MAFIPPFDVNEDWLVKVSGRILGPFTTSEVINSLMSKRVNSTDGICRQSGRWMLVREEVTFSEVVKALKASGEGADEGTKTSTVDSTQAITITDFFIDETPTPVQLSGNRDQTEPSISQGLAVNSSTNSHAQATPKVAGKIESSYGSTADPKFKKKVEEDAWKSRIVIIALSFAVSIGAVYFYGTQNKKKPTAESSIELYNKGLTYKSQGLHKAAISYFKKAREFLPNDPKIDIELAPLLIAYEKSFVEGRRMIEKAIPQGLSPAKVAEGYVGIGLSHMMSADYRNAEEAFQKALGLQPHNQAAKMNLATIDLLTGRAHMAEGKFILLQENQATSALMLLSSVLASIEQVRDNVAPQRNFTTIVQIVKNYTEESGLELSQELNLLISYIYIREGRRKDAIQIVKSLLASEPSESDEHIFDVLVNREVSTWKYLFKYCEYVGSDLLSDPMGKTLLAYCNFRAGKDNEARLRLSEADAIGAKNPVVQLVKAELYRGFGQDAEAKVALDFALIDTSLLRAISLKALFLMAEDNLEAAESKWNELLRLNPKSVQARAGLAEVLLKKDKKVEAQKIIYEGQTISKTYLPLWDIKSRFAGGGA